MTTCVDTGRRTPPQGDPLMQSIANTQLRILLDSCPSAFEQALNNFLKETL